jgi:4-hydroxymandelate oxidase
MSIPKGVITLADYEAHAQRALEASAWAYFSGGAADEITLRANRSSWDGLALWPRVLRPLAGGHTRVSLLGRTLAHPILLAPVAYQKLAHPDGELASACAAAAQGAGYVLSTQASTRLEDVARAIVQDTDRGPLWFQLYLQHDRAFTLDLVQRAEQAGYEALVITVDAPVQGVRDRELRAGLKLPPHVRAVNLQGLSPLPAEPLSAGQSAVFDQLLPHAPTWDDVAWLQAHTHLPILLKGVLHPADAQQAAQLGVAGLIVSNHGGRTLDTALSTAAALPRLRTALGPDMPLIVDGGIRRGTDVLKAMTLGANAVMIGRPAVFGLAVAGAQGVAHVLRVLRDELEAAMALCGCHTLADAKPSLLCLPLAEYPAPLS